jgi:hypothetical protein
MLKNIELAAGAEQYSYDPGTKYVYLGNGGHDASQPYSFISIIETTRSEKTGDIEVETSNLKAPRARNKRRSAVCQRSPPRRAIAVFDTTSGGALSIYREMDPDHYVSEAPLAAGRGRNCIYLPSIHRYDVGVPQHGKTDDQILV